MGWLAGVGFLIVTGVAIDAFRTYTRRPLVEQWARDEGFTLLEMRHAFRLDGGKWSQPYRVRVLDRSGREVTGVVFATGYIRRKVWADWEGSGPRFGHPGP